MRKIDVNWDDVSELGKKTAGYVEIFEESRKKMQEIVLSLNECWQGVDADGFRTNMYNYLESLKEDTRYLQEWEVFFKKSSARYNGGIEDGLNRVKNLEEEYVLPNASVGPVSGGMYDE